MTTTIKICSVALYERKNKVAIFEACDDTSRNKNESELIVDLKNKVEKKAGHSLPCPSSWKRLDMFFTREKEVCGETGMVCWWEPAPYKENEAELPWYKLLWNWLFTPL